MTPPSGTPTAKGIRTFADGDSPDMGAGGLGLILGDIDTRLGLVKIADGVLAGGQFDFSSIPQTFKDLVLVASLRSDIVATSGAGLVRANGDTSSSYHGAGFYVDAGGAPGNVGANTYGSAIYVAAVAGGGSSATFMTAVEIIAYSYTSAQSKNFQSRYFMRYSGSYQHGGVGASWDPTAGATPVAALTRLTLFPETGSFVAPSAAVLYGRS